MLQEVIENQGRYYWLDSPPQTLPASPTDQLMDRMGTIVYNLISSKFSPEVYEIFNEIDPTKFSGSF